MRWLSLGGGILIGLWLARSRSQPKAVAELPENPDNSFAQQVREDSFLERQKANEAYWNRWKAKNIVTMADKIWDYQMDRYEMYEDGEISRYRWNNAILPPSIFYLAQP